MKWVWQSSDYYCTAAFDLTNGSFWIWVFARRTLGIGRKPNGGVGKESGLSALEATSQQTDH